MAERRQSDLFDAAAADELSRRAPLAERMRPRRLDQVVGQRQLLAPGAAFRKLVESDRLSSAILFGPPGTGKTTVARLVAESTSKEFVPLSATSAGVRDVREVLDDARRRLGERGQGTILFLDEIHRFSRSQQDALLPGVEDGTVVLIGATTENPFFALNAPLLSRSTLFRFEELDSSELLELAHRVLALESATADEAALERLVALAEGDARAVIGTLEVALAIVTSGGGTPYVDEPALAAARTTRAMRFGRDEHYDLVSAFIKSIRGSDVDAGLYWLARLIASGEDPRFLARRLVILASEDVGMADPMALVVATAAAAALDRVGLPEASLNLAQAVVHLALAPKSNATSQALWSAQADVEHEPLGDVPSELRDAHYRGASSLGHGVGYEYPHDDPHGWVDRAYLPAALRGRRYFVASEHGQERELSKRLERLRSDAAGHPSVGDDEKGTGTRER